MSIHACDPKRGSVKMLRIWTFYDPCQLVRLDSLVNHLIFPRGQEKQFDRIPKPSQYAYQKFQDTVSKQQNYLLFPKFHCVDAKNIYRVTPQETFLGPKSIRN